MTKRGCGCGSGSEIESLRVRVFSVGSQTEDLACGACIQPTSIKSVIKSIGPRLVPFFKTAAIFFVLYGSEASTSLFYCGVKCAPVVSLVAFVLLNGMSTGTGYYRYATRILIGLITSVIGDVFLVWAHKEYYFELGLLSFAFSHVAYASAFGWEPFNPLCGSVIFVGMSCFYAYIYPSLTGPIVWMAAMYAGVIAIMLWRALSRVQLRDDLWTWTKLCSCVGAMLFVLSDMSLALDRFAGPVPASQSLIMATYYAAQLGLALSVVDSQVDEFLEVPVRYDYGIMTS